MDYKTTIIKDGEPIRTKAQNPDNIAENIQEKIEQVNKLLISDNSYDLTIPEAKYFKERLFEENADIYSVLYDAFRFGFYQGFSNGKDNR